MRLTADNLAFRRPRRQRGFTLIELLVCIAVISLLVALLLPAVMSVRGSARATQCRNNLKQLGLALHNYHDAHQMFPLSYGSGPFTADNRGTSWLQMILPYVDQTNLYEQIDFSASLAAAGNAAVAQTPVSLFICPSDTDTLAGRMGDRYNVPGDWAVTNYKACSGSNWDWGTHGPVVSAQGRFAGNPDGLDHGNGLICRGYGRAVPTRISDVRDGTATTLALGEAVPHWCRHTWWWWFNGSTATAGIPLNFLTEPDLAEPVGDDDWWNNYSFMSRHPGGAFFCLADGSVRFLSENINPQVYRDLGTIQGREVIPDL